MFHELAKKVTAEIVGVLDGVPEKKILALVDSTLRTRRIVVVGAGRVGLACRGFAMRLGHLGFAASTPSDSTATPIGKGDLLIVGSSSGETQTIYDTLKLGKKNGATIFVLTADVRSRMAKEADTVIELSAPTRFGKTRGVASVQPMATLFEQCLQIVFDVVVLMLMQKTRQTHDDMLKRHSNLY